MDSVVRYSAPLPMHSFSSAKSISPTGGRMFFPLKNGVFSHCVDRVLPLFLSPNLLSKENDFPTAPPFVFERVDPPLR